MKQKISETNNLMFEKWRVSYQNRLETWTQPQVLEKTFDLQEIAYAGLFYTLVLLIAEKTVNEDLKLTWDMLPQFLLNL